MSSLQQTLESLQPFVISIRYVEGLAIVDIKLNEGWTIPSSFSSKITFAELDGQPNTFMLFSEDQSFSLDDILNIVRQVIKFNKEKEEAKILFSEKVAELKVLFKSNPLNKLQKLQFIFKNEVLREEFLEEIIPEQPKELKYIDEEEEDFERKTPAYPPSKKPLNQYGCHCTDNEACGKCIDLRGF